ncbi:MAG: 3'(2'), 5'-bisphosphate nucleotidase [Rhodothermales bacterium]|jgi:3'(2'), 5'-bisphosphate nucleotidase
MISSIELRAALEAVSAAAKLTRAVRASASPDTLQKGDRSPVTVADYGSQAVVCRTLDQYFPNVPIIAEESASALRMAENTGVLERVTSFVEDLVPGAKPSEVTGWIDRGGSSEASDEFWTLDPIDGTKGFLRGDQYAVALALIRNGKPVVAALACPALTHPTDGSIGTILWATAGGGCFQSSGPLEGAEPVRVSRTREAALACMSESVESGHSSHDSSARVAAALGITSRPRRMDSQAKYAVVARGEADIYMRLPVRPSYDERIWDHAAGALVVTESGGRVTDIFGKELDFSHGAKLLENTGVVATNGHLHAAVLDALAREQISAV